MNTSRSKVSTPYNFLLPSVVTIGIIIIVPFLLALYMTFNQIDLIQTGGKFIFGGLGNYKLLLSDKRVLDSLAATLLYVIGAVALEVVLGVGISLLLNRQFQGRNTIRSYFLIPSFITPVVGALIWSMFYEPTSGIFNYILNLVHLPAINWLGNTDMAMISIIFVDTWMTTPFMVLIILASMEGIPQELYEVAQVDGARRYHSIRYITLPLAAKAIAIATMLRAIDALKSFDIIYVLTQGGPAGATETLNMYSYTVGFKYFKLGYATTIALIFTLAVTIIAGIFIRWSTSRQQNGGGTCA